MLVLSCECSRDELDGWATKLLNGVDATAEVAVIGEDFPEVRRRVGIFRRFEESHGLSPWPNAIGQTQVSGTEVLLHPAPAAVGALTGERMLDLKIEHVPRSAPYGNVRYWWRLPQKPDLTHSFV